MDLLCHKLLFILQNEAQWVRHGDAGLSLFKEPRVFDVPVTLLVFLKEPQQNESSIERRSAAEGALLCSRSRSALRVQRFPAGLVNFTLEKDCEWVSQGFVIHRTIH